MSGADRIQSFALPDVGEGLTEADILTWRVSVGDVVAVNQVFVEIETAKAAVELPSPFAGQVHRLLAAEGETVPVGRPIIEIDTDPGAPGVGAVGTGDAAAHAGPMTSGGELAAEVGPMIGEMTADGRIATLVGMIPAEGPGGRRRRRSALPTPAGAPPPTPTATPNGSWVAAAGSVSSAGAATAAAFSVDPSPSSGTGAVAGGRAATWTATPDSAAFPQPATAGAAASPRSAAAAAAPLSPTVSPWTGQAPLAAPPVRRLAKELGVDLAAVHATRADGVISREDVQAAGVPVAPRTSNGHTETRVPVKGVRKATAAAMVASAFTAPHVTEFLSVDITATMQLRERLRRRPELQDVSLTPLAFVARAVCLAIGRTPEINAAWDGTTDEIVIKHYVNLGIAAATPRGLIVPVINDADRLDTIGLAAALAELTSTARAGRTPPAAMTGGTFTITNVGVFGIDTGTPIINPGESGIVAVGAIRDTPWVVDGQICIRKICQLAVSFDHRVIDGQQGSQFLADVGALLTDPGLVPFFPQTLR